MQRMLKFSYIDRQLVTIACCIACLVGCTKTVPTLEELVQQASTLPGVRGSQHSQLREEFRLVEQSGTLPEQLNRKPTAKSENAAIALGEVFAESSLVTDASEDAGALLRMLPASNREVAGKESGALTAKYLHEIEKLTAASQLPDCDFGLKFERGFFNDINFLPPATAACRLLLVDAIYSGTHSSGSAAKKFRDAWKWTDWLAESGHMEARVQASLLRREALWVADYLANRPECTKVELLSIQSTLERSLDNWPPVRKALEGERALAIATYEALRLGLIDMLFTLEERGQLRADGVYASLRESGPEQIDADQAAYLEYMRAVLAVADKPFYQRAAALAECDRLLRSSEQVESGYPWFANHLFVLRESLTLAQAELARDRARVEGWLHALAAATGSSPPRSKVSPLNGETYVVQPRGEHLLVALGDRRAMDPRVGLPSN